MLGTEENLGAWGRRNGGRFGTSGSHLKIGLTGSLASGKSTALKEFRKLGFKALSADDIVAKIYREKKISKAQIQKKYNTKAKLKKLEKWIHPLVGKRIQAFMAKQRRPCVVEVPLLFEAGFEKYFDRSVFIFAPRADRLKRVLKRGMDLKLFRLLDSKQWSAKRKENKADYVIRNTTKPELKKQIRRLIKKLEPSR